MAKTLKFNVSFALSCGVSTAQFAEFEKAREATRKAVETKGREVVEKGARGAGKHLVNLYLDDTVSTEQCLVETIRCGIRLQLEELREDDKEGNFQRIGDIKAVPRV